MTVHVYPDVVATERRIRFERAALVLHGVGSLGAYQAGIYEALAQSSDSYFAFEGIGLLMRILMPVTREKQGGRMPTFRRITVEVMRG